MKRFVLYLAIVALFFCVAFAPQPTTAQDNTNKAFKYYTDAVKLLTIYGDTTSAHHLSTKALAEEWIATTEQHKSDAKWNYYVLLTAIYTAGRVQGMREVRSKNKHIEQLP